MHGSSEVARIMRILFVATLFSPLAARWISQLANTEWDVHVFGRNDIVHPLFRARNITIHTIRAVENSGNCTLKRHWDLYPWTTRGRMRLKKVLPQIARLLIKEPQDHLLNIIRNLKPDLVHSLKMQSEAYLTADALQHLQPIERPKWMYSVWGSDIYLNRHFPDKLERIQSLLPRIDYLMADNPRDVSLALEHGFQGKVLGVFPTGGGYPLAQMRQHVVTSPSQRRVIAVKGYQSKHGGQALTALEAIKHCGARFDGYRIVIHSAIGTYASAHLEQVREAAEELSRLCDVPVEFLPYSPPETIWKLFSQSRIALAISNSDGTPNAMLEAMSVGAFPIQSDTGGLEHWIESGRNGYLVPFDDVSAISKALTHALEDDSLVDQAAGNNYALTEEHLDYDIVRRQVLGVYAHILREPRPPMQI